MTRPAGRKGSNIPSTDVEQRLTEICQKHFEAYRNANPARAIAEAFRDDLGTLDPSVLQNSIAPFRALLEEARTPSELLCRLRDPLTQFRSLLTDRAGLPKLIAELERRFAPLLESQEDEALSTWEKCGLDLMNNPLRVNDAVRVFERLYELLVDLPRRESPDYISRRRSTALVWLNECHWRLQNISLAQRYLMLTLVEEAISRDGAPYPEGGLYWRARWQFAMSDEQVAETSAKAFQAYKDNQRRQGLASAECILQSLGDDWKTKLPSSSEEAQYVISKPYATRLWTSVAGDKTGEGLELLAQYLMSCIPGCRTQRRAKTPSTDHDLVCTLDGSPDDFRRDLGRYFLCECKSWTETMGFEPIAKFARVLESTKCKFGVLFSLQGISGAGNEPRNGRRELLKLYHDTGVVVVVLDRDDLEKLADGANLVLMLRRKYEDGRLDIERRRPKQIDFGQTPETSMPHRSSKRRTSGLLKATRGRLVPTDANAVKNMNAKKGRAKNPQ